MVVTKHFATHGEKYRRRLIKYILNPDKTNNLKLVSDFGVSNYLDFPTYEETVEMYNANFLITMLSIISEMIVKKSANKRFMPII